MAASGRISIKDETDVVQLAGTATFPDGIAADGVSTPDVAAGNSDPILIKTGDAPAGDGGTVTIQGGIGGGDSGVVALNDPAGNPLVEVEPGAVYLRDDNGLSIVRTGTAALGFFGVTPAAQPAITGALSAVVDPAAAAVLTSIIAALKTTAGGVGLATDGTT